MDLFTRLRGLVKIRDVLIDNQVCQLHYRVTALLLLGCAALVASKQHFGDPIDCITRDDVSNKIMDTYCWIHSTFTLPEACNKSVGIEVAHPCVDKSDTDHKEDRVYHKYYQWVYFVLFFQAMSFYAPHYFWKSKESKLLDNLSEKFREPVSNDDEDEVKDKRRKFKQVVKYFTDRGSRQHETYYYYFITSEVANFLNVILQIYVVDVFLGGTFTTYGLDVIQYAGMDQEDRVDPMVRVFPRMTKCTFHRFGSSGDVQRYDALCILPLNIINEKIYIVMWFWFVFLAIVTGLWLVYRFMTFFKPQLRLEVLARRATLTDKDLIKSVLNQLDTGDWFLLSMVCKNMDSLYFRVLIERVNERLLRRNQEQLNFSRAKRNARNTNNYIDNNNRESARSTKALLPIEYSDEEQSILNNSDQDQDDIDSRVTDNPSDDEEISKDEKPIARRRSNSPADFEGVTIVPSDKSKKVHKQ